MPKQDQLNAVFVDEVTKLKGHLEMMNDVLNTLDKTLAVALERMAAMNPEFATLQREYRTAMAKLRREGFREGHYRRGGRYLDAVLMAYDVEEA